MQEALLHINIAQSLFTAIIILTKRPLQTIDKLLSGWLLLVLALFTLNLVRINFPEYIGDKQIFGGLITLLFPSFLYLYIKYLTLGNISFQKKDLLHFVLFGSLSIATLVLYIKHPSSLVLVGSFKSVRIFPIVFGTLFYLTFILYGYHTIKLANHFQKKRDEIFSFHNSKVSIEWIRNLVIIFYFYFGIIIITGTLSRFGIIPIEPSLFTALGYTIFLYVITFNGYKQKQILKVPEPVQEKEKTTSPYKKSGLKESDAKKYEDTLIALMKNQKPWLKPEVSINDIATQTNIPQHYITQILNERLKKNFYTLINEYRTNEVIRLFQVEKCKNWSLTSIAFEAGFNSKSSFNAFFKKYTGETPSSYRAKVTSQANS